jgi:hypothetical protein
MIEKSLLTQPLPQILIIKLGSNDLGIAKGKELIELIRCDILRSMTLYPVPTSDKCTPSYLSNDFSFTVILGWRIMHPF